MYLNYTHQAKATVKFSKRPHNKHSGMLKSDKQATKTSVVDLGITYGRKLPAIKTALQTIGVTN